MMNVKIHIIELDTAGLYDLCTLFVLNTYAQTQSINYNQPYSNKNTFRSQ